MIVTEVINLNVRVEIVHDGNDPESRLEAISISKENVLGCATYGSTVCVKPLTSRLVKPRKKG